MPDVNGWHYTPFLMDGRMYRWHYCELQEHDRLVADTPAARAEHQRACRAETRKIRRRLKQEAQRRSLAGLDAYRAERRLVVRASEVLDAAEPNGSGVGPMPSGSAASSIEVAEIRSSYPPGFSEPPSLRVND